MPSPAALNSPLAAQALTNANKQDNLFIEWVGKIIKQFGIFLKNVLMGGWAVLRRFMGGLISAFRTAPMEYITFIVFIIILLTGIMFLAFSPNSPFRSAGGGGGGGGGGGSGGAPDYLAQFLTTFNVDTSWLYRFRGKNGDGLNPQKRPVVDGGRCDGVNNIDVSTGETKLCLNAKLPTVIEWNLDPTKMPEWKKLPPRVQERLSTAKNGTKVYIPWGVAENKADANNPFAKLQRQANTLVPLCSKAYYGDGTSAADLFRTDDETNQSCRMAVVENKSFGARTIPYDDERAGTKTPVNRGEGKTCTL
jgi:hypothetical protein